MELSELQAFLAVADELHFGRAAQRLFLAQPYLSRTIRKLETDLDVTLFERTTRKVELTPAGRILVERATAILAMSADARSEVRRAELGQAGPVRVSFSGPSSYPLIGRLTRALRERYPDIALQFSPGLFAHDVIDLLLEDSLDLAIAMFREIPPAIAIRPIAEEKYVMAVPSNHPAAGSGPIPLETFKDDRFVMLPPRSAMVANFAALCHSAGFAPKIVQTAPDTGTIIALVSAGAGVTLTVDAALNQVSTQGVYAVDLADPADPVYNHIAWRSDSTNKAVHTVLDIARELFPSPEVTAP